MVLTRLFLLGCGLLFTVDPFTDHAADGFRRSFQNEEPRYLAMAYNLPEAILPKIDPVEWLGEHRSPLLETRVAQAKLTLEDMKRGYLNAPPSPAMGELCGTGYVHTNNHNDYANMIGDLRTRTAYDFPIAQAEELARHPSPANYRKLAELAIVLSKR